MLGLPVQYRRTAYVPLAVLHATLLLRLLSNLMAWPSGRMWGAIGNGVAVGLFLLNMVMSFVLTPKSRS